VDCCAVCFCPWKNCDLTGTIVGKLGIDGRIVSIMRLILSLFEGFSKTHIAHHKDHHSQVAVAIQLVTGSRLRP
jgi:hypothetical protein